MERDCDPPAPTLAAPTVFLMCDTLEGLAATLLVHETARTGIALNEITIWRLELSPAFDRPNPIPVIRVFRHDTLLVLIGGLGRTRNDIGATVFKPGTTDLKMKPRFRN